MEGKSILSMVWRWLYSFVGRVELGGGAEGVGRLIIVGMTLGSSGPEPDTSSPLDAYGDVREFWLCGILDF